MKILDSLGKSSACSDSFNLQTAAELLHNQTVRELKPPLLTHLPELDQVQGGGLARGTLIELVGRRSSGRFAIGLAALASATQAGEAAALIDLGDHLDPYVAVEAGVDVTRLLWVRPLHLKEALASTEMVLSTGFGLVVLDLGVQPLAMASWPEAVWTRLERAAQSQNAVLLIISPSELSTTHLSAVITADESHPIWLGEGNSPRLLAGISVKLKGRQRKGSAGERTRSLDFSLHGRLASGELR